MAYFQIITKSPQIINTIKNNILEEPTFSESDLTVKQPYLEYNNETYELTLNLKSNQIFQYLPGYLQSLSNQYHSEIREIIFYSSYDFHHLTFKPVKQA